MYELSFYERDKPIVKFGENIWRPLNIEDSNILTKIVNNNYLKQNHPQISPLTYICDIDCLVKYYTKPDVTITAQAYLFCRNPGINEKVLIKQNIQGNMSFPSELYIPGVLFNGRGLWLYSRYSVLCAYQYANERKFSRNNNFKFTNRKFNAEGILV